jgi:hypothetical protein
MISQVVVCMVGKNAFLPTTRGRRHKQHEYGALVRRFACCALHGGPYGVCEVEVVKRLLAREGRDRWTRVQLESSIGGNPRDLSDALYNLAAVGVICVSEESVTLTSAADDSMLYLEIAALTANMRLAR